MPGGLPVVLGRPFKVAAFIRAVVLLGILLGIVIVILFSSNTRQSPLLNPLFEEWGGAKGSQWGESRLSDHWLFRWVPEDVTAMGIFGVCLLFFLGSLCFYLVWLLCCILPDCCLWPCWRTPPQHEQTSIKQQVVRDVLQTCCREDLQYVHDAPRKIAAIKKVDWPWQGGGLWTHVALMMLDVGLDINTVFTFLSGQHYWFAAVMTFLVVRSTLKQLSILSPWHLSKALAFASVRCIRAWQLLHLHSISRERVAATWCLKLEFQLSAPSI